MDTGFNPIISGGTSTVYASAVQPDGKIIIGGNFSTVNGVSRNNLARLNTDGTLDLNFMNGEVGPNTEVRAIALQPDGRILIGGAFTTVNGISRGRLARLESDGSLQGSFLSGQLGVNTGVLSIALQKDGRIVIAGVLRFICDLDGGQGGFSGDVFSCDPATQDLSELFSSFKGMLEAA